MLSNRRDGATAAPAGPCRVPGPVESRSLTLLARKSGQDGVCVGAPLPRCAPSSPSRIPRILSPASGPRLRTPEAFQTLAFKEPLLSLLATFASSILSFSSGPAHPRGREVVAGGGAETSPHRPFQKAQQNCSVPQSRVRPCRTAGGFVLCSCFLAI